MEKNGFSSADSLSEYRFASAVPTTSRSSYSSYDSWCPFLIAWFRTLSGKRVFADPRRCLEACSRTEGAHVATKLLQCIGKPKIEATKRCIRFYTKDSFLYYVLNKALRDEDHSKLETLGPFCLLLRNYARFSEDFIGTVYRGISISKDEIDGYRKAIGEWKTWSACTCTSKDRDLVKAFGDTLFIIEITPPKNPFPRCFTIAQMSDDPWEQEILLPVGTLFPAITVDDIFLRDRSSELSKICAKSQFTKRGVSLFCHFVFSDGW